MARELIAAALAELFQEKTEGRGRRCDTSALTERFLGAAREVRHLRVGCRDDGDNFTLTTEGNHRPTEIALPRVAGLLRAVCARLAVLGVDRGVGEVTTYTRNGPPRVERGPDLLPPLYGGRCFIRAGAATRPGWAVDFMNTIGEHWFDLTWCAADAAPEE